MLCTSFVDILHVGIFEPAVSWILTKQKPIDVRRTRYYVSHTFFVALNIVHYDGENMVENRGKQSKSPVKESAPLIRPPQRWVVR